MPKNDVANQELGLGVCRNFRKNFLGSSFLGLAILSFVLAGCSSDVREAAVSTESNDMERALPIRGLMLDVEPVVRSEPSREAYDHIVENEFLNALQNPKSTFSVDVDTASYSNVRRLLNDGRRPPLGAVRIEEFVNYFDYQYSQPTEQQPLSVSLDMATCPWEKKHQLLRVALKAREISKENRPASNIVFLLDVSGSMGQLNKLPLVKSAMRLLVEQLSGNDRIAIAVYAGATGIALPSTSINNKKKILDAIQELNASGSTNGAAGIELAYQLAQDNFVEGGTNRVILCTDGDFNVGQTSQSDLVDLIKEKAKSNVFLSVFGFGTGNLQDSTMEKLADKGNGNYGYIDSLLEAHKVFVRQLGANLITVAKDVKIQIDFNPAFVSAYRLIGYENRKLANADFDDDAKDAGEMGAGHSVTAFYEIVPAGVESEVRISSDSEFVRPTIMGDNTTTALVVSLRYKRPNGKESQEATFRLEKPRVAEFSETHPDFQFASSVAAFGMLLRESKFSGNANLDWVVTTAEANLGVDRDGFRSEFVQLAKKSRLIMNREYISK